MSTPENHPYKIRQLFFRQWNKAKHRTLKELEDSNRIMIERLKEIDKGE